MYSDLLRCSVGFFYVSKCLDVFRSFRCVEMCLDPFRCVEMCLDPFWCVEMCLDIKMFCI